MQGQREFVESKVVKEQKIFQGKWLGMKHITFSVGSKIIENYQGVYRTTRKQKAQVDGVQIIPILKYSNKEPQIIMIANFRPPTGKFCMEFPSGLLDNEDIEENARREMKQETGFIIKSFLQIPYPIMYADPWKSNQSGFLYIAMIDGDDPLSRNQQALESTENIRVHILPLNKNLYKSIVELCQKNNYVVEDKVWSLCMGILLTQFIVK